MTTPTIPPPNAKPYIEARIGSMNYRGDGIRCLWDGNGRNESAHDVLEALFRGHHASESQLAAIHALLAPLLGVEVCPTCAGHEDYPGPCLTCGTTGQRNIADGLSPLECVERAVADRCQTCGMGPMTRIADATYCSNCINLASADEEANGLNMWKDIADESAAELIESRKQVARLRERVERHLQTCHIRGICVDCERDREVLAETAPPKEPAK